MSVRYKIVLMALLLSALVGMILSWWIERTPRLSPEGMCLALNTYWEASAAREPLDGQRMVAYVTMMRAKDNKAQWGGATICNVVYHKRFKRKGGVVPEFSWTIKRGTHKPPAHKALWVQAKAAAEDVREGKFIPEGDLQLARFYLRPAHSVRRNVCWFKKNLVFVDIVGKHHFYRLPKNVAEKAILRQSKPPECQPLKRKKNKKKVGAKR